MRNYRNLNYVLLCAGLLATLSGCEKEPEANPDASAIRGTTSAFELEVPDEEEETDADSDNFLKKIFKKNPKNHDKNDAGEEAPENSGTEITTTDTQEASEETKNSENSENTENSEITVSENSAESSAEENNTGSENLEIQGENPDVNTDSDPQNQNTDASQDTDTSQDTSDENTDPNSETPNETIQEATEPSEPDPDALTVSYQGHVIIIGGDATAFVNAVSPLEEPLKAPSCYGDGDDVVYTYDGMTLTTLREADREIVRNVDITSPGIAPVENYDIGTTADFKGEKRITSPNGSMIIITEIGGIVEYISYNIS
ncbi:MAG: hypothetical protein K2J71_10390 [Oscillospiraceae bacterium]|nr:hypothetical protein [Oscillospiraceae bacterium]